MSFSEQQLSDFRSSESFLSRISTSLGYVTSLIDRGPDWEWHNGQLLWLSKTGHKVMNKCRQSGGSTVAAAEEFAEAQLRNKDFAHIFFSITKEEAQNKIGYVKEFMENTPNEFKRKTLYETKQSVEFQNSDGTSTKIISHAQKPSRGLHGNYVFDEADFYQNFKLLFDAAMPGTRKAGGAVKIVSTPFDPAGLFREILMGTDGTMDHNGVLVKKHKNFDRIIMNWWSIPFYCDNVEEAAKFASRMSTQERVEKYGSRILKEAFRDARTLDTFQQEYECSFLEKDARFFTFSSIKNALYRTWDEIQHEDFSLHWNQEESLELVEEDQLNAFFPMERKLFTNKVMLNTYVNTRDASDLESIELLKRAVRNGEIRGELICGIDIGTTGHSTDISIFEEVPVNGKMMLVERFYVTRNNWSLPDQQEWIINNIMNALPLRRVAADTNGIGMQLGQELERRYPSVFEPMPMQSGNLGNSMYSLQEMLEAGRIALSSVKERAMAIYQVRRDISPLGNSLWKLQKTGTSHSDSAISAGIASYLFLQLHRGHAGSGMSNQGIKPINTYVEVQKLSSNDYNRANISRGFEKTSAKLRARGRNDMANIIDKMGRK